MTTLHDDTFERRDETFHDNPTLLRFKGTVVAGMGKGRQYISLEGYKRQFVARLGYEPFPGTLNVELSAPSADRRSALEDLDSICIDSWEADGSTFGAAVCYPATVTNDETVYAPAHVIVPDRTGHDETQLELIAPDELRTELNLADDDALEIVIRSP